MAMPLEPQDTASVETAAAAAKSSASAEPRPARGDVATLLRQLAQQKDATTRALESTLAIEKQLAQTREDLNRALMIAAIPPDPPPKPEPEDEAHPESSGRKAHQELENERKARVDERITAAARIARLEETVVHAREKEKNALSSMKRARVFSIVIAAGLLLGAILLTRLAARYPMTSVAHELTPASAPESKPEVPRAAPAAQAAEPAGDRSSAKTSSGEDLAPQTSLENAVAEMHRALTAFPDSKPEEIITALHAGSVKVDPSSCLLAWNEGQPELLVQDRRGDGAKIAQTLTQCASAIEGAHHGMIAKSQAKR